MWKHGSQERIIVFSSGDSWSKRYGNMTMAFVLNNQYAYSWYLVDPFYHTANTIH